MRFLLVLFLVVCTVDAEQTSQKDLDTFKLILKLSELEQISFTKEIDQLFKSLEDQSLIKIAKGVLAYKKGDIDLGFFYFKTIGEQDKNFELMIHQFRESISETQKSKKEHFDFITRALYETHLREKQKPEIGCVQGFEDHYRELVKNDPQKKRSFEVWLKRKREEFYKANPGSWYTNFYYTTCRVNLKKLREVNDPVEKVLLNIEKPGKNFNALWGKIHSQRKDAFEQIKNQKYSMEPHFEVIDSLLEEMRLFILSGKGEKVNPALSDLRTLIAILEKTEDYEGKEKQIKVLKGKLYYLKGLNAYLQGMNERMRGEDGKKELIGRTGAIVQFYLSGLRGEGSEWAEKSRLLYNRIFKNTREWFGVGIREFDYRKK